MRFSRPIAEPLCTRFNYNTEWADNPWLDRRVPYAFHLATDRAAIIDHVYQGQARPSAIQRINWYHPWSIPEDQLHRLPGFRSNKDEDIAYARELLAAAGVEPGSEFRMLFSDSFVDQHTDVLEIYASTYNTALDLDLRVDLRSNAIISQMPSEGTFPGHLPMPVPSSTGDPIESWLEELVFDASENLEGYNFPPVEELIKGIAEQWDLDKRRETTSRLLKNPLPSADLPCSSFLRTQESKADQGLEHGFLVKPGMTDLRAADFFSSLLGRSQTSSSARTTDTASTASAQSPPSARASRAESTGPISIAPVQPRRPGATRVVIGAKRSGWTPRIPTTQPVAPKSQSSKDPLFPPGGDL